MASKKAYSEMVNKLKKDTEKRKLTAAVKTAKRYTKPTKPIAKSKIKAKKETWVSRLKSKVKSYTATEDKKRQLRRSISEADIKKFQGKKKNNPNKKRGGY